MFQRVASDAVPRTTLDLDAAVLAELRCRQRHEKGKTLGQLVSELLTQAFDEDANPPDPLRWVARPMGPRVDLADKESLRKALGDQ